MNNEDKILNLLETMYADFNKRFENIENEVKENRKTILNLENNLTDKLRGLYDNREVVNDKLDEIDQKLDNLQIDVNNLTIKTAHNDNRIINLTRKNKDIL